MRGRDPEAAVRGIESAIVAELAAPDNKASSYDCVARYRGYQAGLGKALEIVRAVRAPAGVTASDAVQEAESAIERERLAPDNRLSDFDCRARYRGYQAGLGKGLDIARSTGLCRRGWED